MKTKSAILVGVGGQGAILTAKVLVNGLMKAGYDVKMSEVHGMSQRGGSVSTQVHWGEKVYSPVIGDGAADLEDPKLAEALKEAEKRLSEAVNELFNSDDAAAAFFGRMHPFSPVNGEFYATQVLQKVGAFIGAQFDTETKAMSKKARKYLR